MVDSTDEKCLLAELGAGSFQAFEKLYHRYSGKLYNFIMRISSGNRYMAEEVVQSTFIRIWEVRGTVDPESSFISFLCTIAKNLLMNMYQRQMVEFVYNEYLMKSGIDRDFQTEEGIDLHFLHEYIDSLADKLPEQRKKIFILSKRQHYTNKEIAEQLGISESTVATHTFVAKFQDMVDSTDEKCLLAELGAGSFQAFEKLYHRYSGKLYNFIMRISSGNRYMAEEVVQSTFIRIWEVRGTVDPESSFISFLCTIAKNLLMNMYQRQMVEFVYNEYLMKSGIDRDFQTEEGIDLHFLHEYIDSLADKLPEQRKKIFILSKRQHYTNKEIAEQLGISESTVATQLSLAVKFMRTQLMQNYDAVLALLFVFFVNEV